MYKKMTIQLSAILSVVVIILSVLDISIVVTSPWWLNYLYESKFEDIRVMLGYNYQIPDLIYPLMLIFFIASGILCLGILISGFRILQKIKKLDPFCIQNAKSLKFASLCGFLLFVIFVLKMFYSPSILTVVCSVIFLLFSLFILVIAQLVDTAAKIKEENDLTI